MPARSENPTAYRLPPYSQAETVATLTDFYQCLSKLPWVELDDILYPPEEGWPNITNETFGFLAKNEDVISLLRHLPYIRQDGQGKGEQYVIAHNTFPCDYRRDYFRNPSFGNLTPWDVPETGDRDGFPPWVVPLAYGKNHGDYLMFDTTDGTVTRYQVTGGGYPPEYAADDPRSWRNECEPGSEPLAELLSKWKAKHESLEWIGFTRAGWPHIWDDGDEELAELQEIIQSHGWPDGFKRDECKRALAEWERQWLRRK
ncbi:hypothetical protein F5B20DRAFT_95990 [Whalleya microplaca]|nr:hypothetical protein F5B20DRAFT_95990 [Whalleya microplaca]